MSPATRAAIEAYERADLFSAVGRPLPGVDFARSPVWQHAFRSCLAQAWLDVKLEAENQFFETVAAASPQRWRQFDSAFNVAAPAAERIVTDGVRALLAAHGAPPEVAGSVVRDIYMHLMECEYGDVVDPADGFFGPLGAIYRAGHFPCGWNGDDLAAGRVIVF